MSVPFSFLRWLGGPNVAAAGPDGERPTAISDEALVEFSRLGAEQVFEKIASTPEGLSET